MLTLPLSGTPEFTAFLDSVITTLLTFLDYSVAHSELCRREFGSFELKKRAEPLKKRKRGEAERRGFFPGVCALAEGREASISR